MFCENCGAEIQTGAKFCENCGAPLPVAELSKQEPPKPASDTVIPPRMEPPAPSASVGQQSGSYQAGGTYAEPQPQVERPAESVGFAAAIRDFFSRYTDFRGRTVRSGFWWVVLFHSIVAAALSGVERCLPGISFLSTLYTLAVLCPDIAMCVRRMHDIGKSGKWVLMALIPIVGWIWLVVQYVKPTCGDNQWGLAPESCKQQPPQI